MDKFTVKDFITYNNPCFSCGGSPELEVGFDRCKATTHSLLSTIVTNNYVEISLHIRYTSMLKLLIFHKTNRILPSDRGTFIKYLQDHNLFLVSKCKRCATQVVSSSLNFHIDKSYLEPTFLYKETLVVSNKEHQFILNSSFIDKKSRLLAYRKGDLPNSLHLPPVDLDLPLMPIGKLKSRESFIEKCKTYMIFS